MRRELTIPRKDLARRLNLESFQPLVTDLAARIENTNMRRDMSNSVRKTLADGICFIAVVVVHMARINAVAVFEDVAMRILNCIPHIMAVRYIKSTLIDEDAYRDFEENNPVWYFFAEERPAPAFHITAAQRNQLISVFGDATATCTALQKKYIFLVGIRVKLIYWLFVRMWPRLRYRDWLTKCRRPLRRHSRVHVEVGTLVVLRWVHKRQLVAVVEVGCRLICKLVSFRRHCCFLALFFS